MKLPVWEPFILFFTDEPTRSNSGCHCTSAADITCIGVLQLVARVTRVFRANAPQGIALLMHALFIARKKPRFKTTTKESLVTAGSDVLDAQRHVTAVAFLPCAPVLDGDVTYLSILGWQENPVANVRLLLRSRRHSDIVTSTVVRRGQLHC